MIDTARSTMSSVSGRGTSTPGPTAKSYPMNSRVPMRYAIDSPPTAPGNEFLKFSQLVFSQLLIGIDCQPGAVFASEVTQQQLGVEPGSFDASVTEFRRGNGKRPGDRSFRAL